MTEEAFLQTILARPGEDTPRLVYADWLDDHGAPDRAAYLRAEAAAPGRTAPAAGLDPVWVARISRPPAGVFSEHLLRSATGGTPGDADIDAAAAELGVDVPPQLRALLLNYDLGRLRGGPYRLPTGYAGGPVALEGFVCLLDPDWDDDTVSHELVDRTRWLRDEYELDREYVYLAETRYDVVILVSCGEPTPGAVYLLDGDRMHDGPEQGLTPIADSVGAFLAALEPLAWPLPENSQPGG